MGEWLKAHNMSLSQLPSRTTPTSPLHTVPLPHLTCKGRSIESYTGRYDHPKTMVLADAVGHFDIHFGWVLPEYAPFGVQDDEEMTGDAGTSGMEEGEGGAPRQGEQRRGEQHHTQAKAGQCVEVDVNCTNIRHLYNVLRAREWVWWWGGDLQNDTEWMWAFGGEAGHVQLPL